MGCPRRAGWVSCVALAVCGLPVANASAATVGLNAEHSNAVFIGAPGETNNVDYARADNGEYVFAEHDPNATLTTGGAGGACTSKPPRVVVCTAPIAVLSFSLGDGDDLLHGAKDNRTPRVVADGGPGNDR